MAPMGVNVAIRKEHPSVANRWRPNALVGAILGMFVLLVFGITIVKMSGGQMMEAFDHAVRPSLLENER